MARGISAELEYCVLRQASRSSVKTISIEEPDNRRDKPDTSACASLHYGRNLFNVGPSTFDRCEITSPSCSDKIVMSESHEAGTDYISTPRQFKNWNVRI